MKAPHGFDPEAMAPCGVLCPACSACLNPKNPCPGCRAPAEAHKRKSCQNCAKKACAYGRGHRWCFECERFPCARIRDLSRRYVANYGVDLIADGLAARADMDAFLAAALARLTCPACGGMKDQHHRRCSECGAEM